MLAGSNRVIGTFFKRAGIRKFGIGDHLEREIFCFRVFHPANGR